MQEYFVTMYVAKRPSPCKFLRNNGTCVHCFDENGRPISLKPNKKCADSTCPYRRDYGKPCCRVSVGKFTPEEKKAFEELTGINEKEFDNCFFELRTKEDLCGADEIVHEVLIKESTQAKFYDGSSKKDSIGFMLDCVETAKRITLRKEATIPEQTVGMESPQTDSKVQLPVNAVRPKKKATKRQNLKPLRVIAKELVFSENEEENDDWILVRNIDGIKGSSLKTRRAEGETIKLENESILCRDKQGRISWKPEEDSQKIFYLRRTLLKTDMLMSKKKSEKE